MKPIVAATARKLEAAVSAYQSQMDERGREYLSRRGILYVAERFRLGRVVRPLTGDEKVSGRLAIPTLSARGSVVGVSFRCIEDHDCRDAAHGKYNNWPGLDSRLFNVGAVTSPGSSLNLVEGQVDAMTLEACGQPAVAIPGSQSWRSHHHRLFHGFERVLFWADRDDKGASMELFARVQMAVPQVELVHLPEGYDINSYYTEHGKDALLRLVHDESYDDSTDEDEVLDAEEGEDFDPFAGEHFDEDGNRIPF